MEKWQKEEREELVRREISSVLEPFYALIKDMIFDDIAYYS